MIARDLYLRQLIDYMGDGQIKVITGIRRCGKSVLLFHLFYDYLIASGVPADHILQIALDKRKDAKYRNPITLSDTISERIKEDGEKYYLFVDEIQMAYSAPDPDNPGYEITVYDMLNELKDYPAPTCAQIDGARARAQKYIDVFRHCQRCRADAIGVPGEKDYGDQIWVQRIAHKDTFSHG